MKRIFAVLLSILLIATVFPFKGYYCDDSSSIDSVLIASDGTGLKITCSIPNGGSSTYYIFKVHASNESIASYEPIASAEASDGQVVFDLSYDSTDHTEALYGYILAAKNPEDENTYTPLTPIRYIDNLRSFSHSNKEMPVQTSKKGLEVQYITDAQLLGVSHTVVHAQLNELISNEEKDSIAYVFGDEKYFIDKNAITVLDYRIKTLTDAGINVYLDLILSYDSSAPEYLYCPGAKGENNKFFAPNLTTHESTTVFAAAIHFLAERYTSEIGEYGFCGRFILGYEVNDVERNHSTGSADLISNVNEYAKYLRIADIAAKSAYSNAKVYASFSNRFRVNDPEASEIYGTYNYLTELNKLIPDIDYGIAINPYPSSLTESEYWKDEKATDSIDTEYITMKNISVFTSFLKEEQMLCDEIPRSVVITEFGTSGVYGEESENIQAASFAYAYYTAENDPLIEAFIWHRHVDHVSELNLSYGLYSSTEYTLDAANKKLIHDVFSYADCNSFEAVKIISELLQYLPIDSYEELIGSSKNSRELINIIGLAGASLKNSEKITTLYDLSKNLYTFFPSDNTEYVERISEDGSSFMRIASFKLTNIEYRGAGIKVNDAFNTKNADYITVRVRVTASDPSADFSLILSGVSSDSPILVNLSTDIRTNEWITVSFPASQLKGKSIDDCILKLWVKTESSRNEQIFLDLSEISLYKNSNKLPSVIIAVLIAVAITVLSAFAAYLIIYRVRIRKQK